MQGEVDRPGGVDVDKLRDETTLYNYGSSRSRAAMVLTRVFSALEERGYDPVAQLVGYLMSGDPTYITSHREARTLIRTVERDELLSELVESYMERAGIHTRTG
ncbi:MAG: IreB family regulatory phosphoprotein [Firmicutes bacterium]|nr:IreB family regulatory phosphoprotein [Bacillota bacterium]